MSDRPSFDLAALTERMRNLQGSLAGMNDAVGSAEATGHAGGGLVTAKVNGEGRVTSLRMDPSVIDPDDPQTLEDLIIGAIDAAQSTLRAARAEQVEEFTQGLTGLAAGLREQTARRPKSPPVNPFAGLTDGAAQPPQGGPAPR
ncbi:YbaB/EbfC family nucleoid-associated protein [Streptomyces catenulae]|uniref:Nucleoid-associated protein AB0E61_01100 n=1 Tax=Streptomyces catenulae TaxID=66875 RepID=A0ABV2YSJ0_9ACTN|nr:YbaB/EbfC family nucleoid-associated protein [Streptomyces catenulae]